ncbi:transposase, MuDR [Tanacetum coccineum]
MVTGLEVWYFRKDGSAFDPHTVYADHPEVFSMKLFHGGTFTPTPNRRYFGGKVQYIDLLDIEQFTITIIHSIVKMLKYDTRDIMYYHFKIPDKNLDWGLKALASDDDIVYLLNLSSSSKPRNPYKSTSRSNAETVPGGQLLTAMSVENNGIYPVAYGIVESESLDSQLWSLSALGDDLDLHINSNFTFITDRQKGLPTLQSRDYFIAEHSYCFNRGMEVLKSYNINAYEWLQKIHAEHWSRSHFSGNGIEKIGRLHKEGERKSVMELDELVRGVKLSKKGSTITCSNCKEKGHTKRGCKASAGVEQLVQVVVKLQVLLQLNKNLLQVNNELLQLKELLQVQVHSKEPSQQLADSLQTK